MPDQPPNPLFGVLHRSRPLLLLLALVTNIVAAPLLGPWLRLAVQFAVILAAASLAADTAGHRRVTAVLAVPALLLGVLTHLQDSRTLDWIEYAFLLGLYVHVIRLLLDRIFHARVVTLDEIGLALCAYVLLGVLWLLFYMPIVTLDPAAFAFANPPTPDELTTTMLYFSYVTLTTLGYGDISPVSPLAKGLTAIEALTGVLFLAVLISRLVGTYSSRTERE